MTMLHQRDHALTGNIYFVFEGNLKRKRDFAIHLWL